MGLFDDMFGAPDPTRHWKGTPGLVPDFDLDRHALCGVRPGDPVAWLEKLGRCEDQAAAKEGEYRWYTRGIAVDVDLYAVSAFIVHFADDREEGYAPFGGPCSVRGRSVPLTPETTEKEFGEAFGEPYWRDRETDETILFYEFGDIEWQAEFTSGRRLRLILVMTPPMLADEDQRKTYKIDKPWPPG
ncbi:MAG: hypothetical protein HY897_15585 [Deltaproteobacteria bacterium]|nr:hypothetical protein [Deltaproteobacteria bacterium]